MNKVVIVDIDGTIAKVGDRLNHLHETPCNWDAFYDRCDEDEPISEMIDLVYSLYLEQYGIVFCTGRRESCREKTVNWINKHFEREVLKYGMLLMRPNSDNRHDIEVKPEMLQNARISLDEIAFVLEDRNSMVKKWREMGLICLQVAEGDF